MGRLASIRHGNRHYEPRYGPPIPPRRLKSRATFLAKSTYVDCLRVDSPRRRTLLSLLPVTLVAGPPGPAATPGLILDGMGRGRVGKVEQVHDPFYAWDAADALFDSAD